MSAWEAHNAEAGLYSHWSSYVSFYDQNFSEGGTHEEKWISKSSVAAEFISVPVDKNCRYFSPF